jgi:hypothetical protein
MFREVRVYEIREVLRLWVRGEGLRSIDRLAGMDRKTVRRYVSAAIDAGVERAGGEGQLNDVLLASICEKVRPHRPDGRGVAWGLLAANHELLKGWLVDDGLTVVKAGELLARRGTAVPERTLHRYALEVLGVGRSARGSTVRVTDGEPGVELQIDRRRSSSRHRPAAMQIDPDILLLMHAKSSSARWVWYRTRVITRCCGCSIR